VKICGLVSGLKEIMTKKGDRMAFMTLEDMKGFVEVILFPEVFKAALPYLRGGDPVLVRGTLDLSEEHVKIKGMEIRSLPDVALSTEKILHLKVPFTSLTKSQLADLKEIITAHKGLYKVVLHLTDGKDRETIIAFSDQYQVDPSQSFQNHIRDLFKSPVIHLE
jgi:DNA polymerase-3 subunit alpha